VKTNDKLGRSINDLIDENKTDFNDNEEVIEIDLSVIRPNPDQPRTIFDEKSLIELSQSIKEHGVFQPVILKPANDGYILVAGERRVKAARIAGLHTIPAIIRDYNSIYLSELAILENLQREDLTPIEEAIAFQKAIVNLSLTHEELGKKIGKSRVYVTNIIGLLNLPATVIESVNRGLISMGHARALSKLKDHVLCVKLHDRIIDESLTVRDIEEIIRNIHKPKSNIGVSNEYLDKSAEKLNNYIGKNIKFRLKKNQLLFSFEDKSELDKIIKLFERNDIDE
jgi:ParB family chromosome partitioning protein